MSNPSNRPSNERFTQFLRYFEFDSRDANGFAMAHTHRIAHENLMRLFVYVEETRAESRAAVETNERLPNLVDRLKRINAINDDPGRYNSEIDKLTACGKFIASDEYCELLIGHEGRCGLLPGTPAQKAAAETLTITGLREGLELIQEERVKWAKTCSCNCPACESLFEVVSAIEDATALKANACQCDPNPSIGGSPPCPVHDGESEDAV